MSSSLIMNDTQHPYASVGSSGLDPVQTSTVAGTPLSRRPRCAENKFVLHMEEPQDSEEDQAQPILTPVPWSLPGSGDFRSIYQV